MLSSKHHFSTQLRRQAGYVSAINVHICSVVLGAGCAGSYVPDRSATYENQGLSVKVIR